MKEKIKKAHLWAIFYFKSACFLDKKMIFYKKYEKQYIQL